MKTDEQYAAVTDARPDAGVEGERLQVAGRIDRGIRATFVLSLLAIPVGYLTQLLLAHTSSDAVGVYNGILLWSALAQSLYYFGGNAVIIKFLPALGVDAASRFFVSYGGLVLLVTSVGIVPFALFPGLLRSAVGPTAPTAFLPVLFVIALENIILQIALAALKATLRLDLAQLLARISTIGYVLAFGAARLASQTWMKQNEVLYITSVHIALVGLSLVLALSYVGRGLHITWSIWEWWLPQGFWRFCIVTQLSSVLNFLSTRLDQVLVLAYAGVSGFAVYAILSQLAVSIQLVSGFFLDSMLPVLSTVLVRSGPDATRSAYRQGSRLNQVIVTGLTLGLLCFGDQVLRTFGGVYAEHRKVFIVLVSFTGLNSLGMLNAFLLISLGKVERILVVQAVQVGVFMAVVALLRGKSSELLAMAIAQGVAMNVGLIGTIVATGRFLPLGVKVPREFVSSVIAIGGVTFVRLWVGPVSGAVSCGVFLAGSVLFLVGGRYRRREILTLLSLVGLSRVVGGDGINDGARGRRIFSADVYADRGSE